jgi:hypothetical protein
MWQRGSAQSNDRYPAWEKGIKALWIRLGDHSAVCAAP